MSKVRRIWPCQGGEGHFIARLVKAGTPRALPAPGCYPPEEQLWLAAAAEQNRKQKPGKGKPARSERGDARASRRENARALRDAVQGSRRRESAAAGESVTPAQSLAAWNAFAQRYFPALADRPAVVHGGGVLLPAAFPQTGLHVLRAGVFVGSVQKGRFVPEHHLFTAFGAQCTNREELALADPRVVEYLSGREDRRCHRRRRLVLCHGGRVPPRRRQSVGRAGQKPLSQGAEAAVKQASDPAFLPNFGANPPDKA